MKTIYKFEHNNNIYIGSTTDLKVRCWAHNQHKKQEKHKHLKLYKYCNDHGIEDVREYIEVLEEFDNKHLGKIGMRIIEHTYIKDFSANLNMISAISKKMQKKKNIYN